MTKHLAQGTHGESGCTGVGCTPAASSVSQGAGPVALEGAEAWNRWRDEEKGEPCGGSSWLWVPWLWGQQTSSAWGFLRGRAQGRTRQVLCEPLAGGAGRKGAGAERPRVLAGEWCHGGLCGQEGWRWGSRRCWSPWESLGRGDQAEVSGGVVGRRRARPGSPVGSCGQGVGSWSAVGTVRAMTSPGCGRPEGSRGESHR